MPEGFQKVSISQGFTDLPDTKYLDEPYLIDHDAAGITNEDQEPYTLKVFVKNIITVGPHKKVGQFGSMTTFHLQMPWSKLTMDEKVRMFHLAYHTSVVQFLIECKSKGIDFPPIRVLSDTFVSSKVRNVQLRSLETMNQK